MESPQDLTKEANTELIAQESQIAAHINATALANFQTACHDWLAENIELQANKQPPTEKPSQPEVFHDTSTISADGLDVALSWRYGPDKLGQPCPDVPAATIPSGTAQLGTQISRGTPGPGTIFAAGLIDTTPIDAQVTIDGHKYVKRAWGFFTNPNSDGSIPGIFMMIS